MGIGTDTPTSFFEIATGSSTIRLRNNPTAGFTTTTAEWIGTGLYQPQMTFNADVLSLTPGGNARFGTNLFPSTVDVNGTLKLVDGTEGAGKVLTSDANGNASWQASSVKANFAATHYGQPAFILVPNVEYTADLANIKYANNMTYSGGVITIQVDGIYHFDFLASFAFGYTNTQQLEVKILKDGGLYSQEFERALSLDMQLSAGQTVEFTMRQHTGSDVQLGAYSRISGHKVD